MTKLALALLFGTVPSIYWSAPAWNAATTYNQGNFIQPAGSPFTFMCTDGGTSGAAQPIWCVAPDGCNTIEDGGNVFWNEYPLNARTYCPFGATLLFATPSKAAGASSLTFDAVLWSNAASGSTINLYGDGNTSVLTGGTTVTGCTACLVTLSNVVLPVTAGAIGVHTVRANALTAGSLVGTADTSFTVDYRSPNTPLTIVLTFDDSFVEQYSYVAPVLEDAGFRGTFYVNSQRLAGLVNGGLGYGVGYMTPAMVQSLQNRGHEIGIHTISHQDLPCMGTATQHIEIGNDALYLSQLGINLYSTAYPFGANEIPQTWQVDTDMQLISGRDIGFQNNARGYCKSNPSNFSLNYSNPIPVKIPFDFYAQPSLAPTCAFSDLQNYVLDAASHGGGLLVLNSHHVCPEKNTTCDATVYPSPTLSVDLTAWTNFIQWLAGYVASTPGVSVKREIDVLGGAPHPPKLWPYLNVKNGSVEDWANAGTACLGGPGALPDCFYQSTTGSSNAVYTWAQVASPVHSGLSAWKLNITNSPTQGTVRMVTGQHAFPQPPVQDIYCPETTAQPGQICTASFWYQSSNTIDMVVYSFNPPSPPNGCGTGGATGTWFLQKSINALAASPGVWAQASYTFPVSGTGSVPNFCQSYDGGIPIEFGPSDSTTGSVSNIIVDDFDFHCP